MKKQINLLSLLAIVFLSIGTACESEDPGLASVSLKMSATTTQSAINPNGRMAAADGLVFTEVLLGVSEIEFETLEEEQSEDDDDGHEIESEDEDIEFKGVFIVDVLNGTSNPDFGIATLAPGRYSEIEMEMGPVLPNQQSISIKAVYTSGGVEYPVEYTSSDDFELEIEREAGFILSEGSLSNILIVIDLDGLFNAVDLNSASVDNDGVIRINESSNASLASIIKNNLENALEAGEDDDDDNEIDD